MDQVTKQKIKDAMHRHDWQEVEEIEALEDRHARLQEAKFDMDRDAYMASLSPAEKRELKFQRERRKQNQGRLVVRPCGLGS